MPVWEAWPFANWEPGMWASEPDRQGRWGWKQLQPVDTYLSTLFCSSCGVSILILPFSSSFDGKLPFSFGVCCFCQKPKDWNAFTTLARMSLTLFFVFTFWSRIWISQSSVLTWNKLVLAAGVFVLKLPGGRVLSLIHWATITLLLQWVLLGEGVPWADLRNGCCLLVQTQCWPCSPSPVPEEGLYLILCNSYWSPRGSKIKLCLEMQNRCINLYLREKERGGTAG